MTVKMKKIAMLMVTLCAAATATLHAQNYMVVKTTDGEARYDVTKIKEVYFKNDMAVKTNDGEEHYDVAKVKEVTFVEFNPEDYDNTIDINSPEGEIGMLYGREAMVITLAGEKMAIATCNVGAETPEDCGSYYSFTAAKRAQNNGEWGYGWRLPTIQEIATLLYYNEVIPFSFTHHGDVAGAEWLFGTLRTALFFPLAGEYSYGEVTGYGEVGYYWTSSSAGDGAWCLGLMDNDTCYVNAYETDVLSVRPVCALPEP